jgi:Ca2+-binding RTX toxin-like protein
MDADGTFTGAFHSLRFANDAGKFYEVNNFDVTWDDLDVGLYYDLEDFLAADVMGDSGNDLFIADEPGDSFTEQAGGGVDIVQAFVDFVLPDNIENLVLREGNYGGGNRLDNAITGNDGNNSLDGGRGSDNLAGGNGNDTYWVDQLADRLVEASGGGTDQVMARISHALASNFENLTLAAGAGNLDGTGNAQANIIIGNAGSNTLDGGDGNDSLRGQGGDDVLIGGGGNDTLASGTGQDLLTGGAGNDHFLFDTPAWLGGNADTITDFAKGQDKLVLDNDVYAELGVAGADLNGQFVSGAGVSAQDADHHLLYDTATGQLFYDADGSGFEPALLIATLTGKPALAATDILVGE